MLHQLKELSTDELLNLATTAEQEATFAEAVGELVLRYKSIVYWQARSICRNDPSLADDVFQNTFLRLFTWLKTRRGKVILYSFPGLLKVFAHRAAIDLMRKEEHTATLPEIQIEPDIEMALYAHALLETLEGDQLEVVRLTFFEDLSAKEIASQLGLTPGNVRVLRYRALEKIRERQALDELAKMVDSV